METIGHRRLYLVLCLCFLSCAACTVEPTPSAPAAPVSVASDNAIAEVSPSPPTREHAFTPEGKSQASTLVLEATTPANESGLTTTPGPSGLVGPLTLLIAETPGQPEIRAAILDLGGLSIRDLNLPNESLTASQWMADGCELYLNGRVYDLTGNLIWRVPSSIATRLGSLNLAQLSPQKNWLAYPVFSGPETYDSTEFVDIEVTSLSPPFSFHRLTQRGGAEAEAFAWSPDEKWVYFSDYDSNGILQIFRATPDGATREQLTEHTRAISRVDDIALSDDGRRVAYGVSNLVATSLPYQYDEADEGWVGIIDVMTASTTTIRLPKFGDVYRTDGLWWNSTGDELLVYGDSLPIVSGDALYGKQMHWIRVDQGGIPFRSVYQSQTPGNSVAWMMPFPRLETLFLKTNRGYYLLQGLAFSLYEGAGLLGEIEAQNRIIDFIPGPNKSYGEAACEG